MDDSAYIVDHPPALTDILNRTVELEFGMASELKTGALLRALAASKPSGHLLELGTGTGIATAWLLAGMDPNSTLVSVDVDPKVQEVARTALGGDPRLILVIEDGAAFLRGQAPQSFDLVFADAMPGKYESLEDALSLVKPGGFYVIDDMLPQPNWPHGHAAKVPLLMEKLISDTRFVVAPMSWATGVVILVRKSTAMQDNEA
jgi:predicted O-methyltransferase YrrM